MVFTVRPPCLLYTSKSYRDKRVKNDPSDWLIFENTHEAIVDPETWQRAEQVKRTVRRTDTTGIANPLTGLVFGADCGAKMYNHRGKRKKAGREYSVDFYSCSTYTPVSYTHLDVYKRQAVGTAIYDLSSGMMGDRIMELVLHRGEKLLCDGAFLSLIHI